MLKSRLPQIVSEMAVAVDAAIVASAKTVAEGAERRLESHRHSGELQQQVHVDESRREGVYVVAGDPKDPSFAFWGHMLEHGTSHSAPHPFLVPALEERRNATRQTVAFALRDL